MMIKVDMVTWKLNGHFFRLRHTFLIRVCSYFRVMQSYNYLLREYITIFVNLGFFLAFWGSYKYHYIR